jgi:hypothetical protein
MLLLLLLPLPLPLPPLLVLLLIFHNAQVMCWRFRRPATTPSRVASLVIQLTGRLWWTS